MKSSGACAVLHHPREFGSRSGMGPLVEALGADPFWYDAAWEHMQRRSWTAGHWLRDWGNRHYGSGWNSLVPYRDESRLKRHVARTRPAILHFIWGEFASPRRAEPYRRRGVKKLVGTFHCSARRQRSVLAAWRDFSEYDTITLMSESQRPFFVERGYPSERIVTILHGVDTEHFSPASSRATDTGKLRMLIVGNTERDHEFMGAVMRELPAERFHLDVCCNAENQRSYAGLPHVRAHPFVAEPDMLRLYRDADVLSIPLLDCTANNAVMEAMACGTPVMANRVGGIPEYVSAEAGMLVDGKDVDEWADRLQDMEKNRERLAGMRASARKWAEQFEWKRIAERYQKLYA